jgi:hypothetical protein
MQQEKATYSGTRQRDDLKQTRVKFVSLSLLGPASWQATRSLASFTAPSVETRIRAGRQ